MDIAPSSERYINIIYQDENKTKYYDIFFDYKKKKISLSKSFEYGINNKSSIFCRIISEENIYQIKFREIVTDSRGGVRPTQEQSILKQISAYVEGGAVMNILKTDYQILSSYFLMNPGISYIYPGSDSFYSFENSYATLGVAYGISGKYTYAEISLLDKVHFNDSFNEMVFGITVGIKPRDNLEFFINSTFSSGAKEYMDPKLESYIKEKSHYDKFYRKETQDQINFSDQLRDFFIPKKRYPYAKAVLGSIYHLTNYTSVSFEIGTPIVWRSFESGYLALGLRRKF